MSVHDGHRQRLKERFRKEGLDNFDELYVLELLLFYCVPRQDTNPLAHRLLDHFGSLVKVLEATPEELEKVPGVNQGISTFFALRAAVDKYYSIRKSLQTKKPAYTMEDCKQILSKRYLYERNEKVCILSLDAKCGLISCEEVGEGCVNSANVPIRRIVEMALVSKATFLVVAHNHPSGIAIPSPEDVQATQRLADALAAVEIYLADHFIFARNDFVSLAEAGYYRPLYRLNPIIKEI